METTAPPTAGVQQRTAAATGLWVLPQDEIPKQAQDSFHVKLYDGSESIGCMSVRTRTRLQPQRHMSARPLMGDRGERRRRRDELDVPYGIPCDLVLSRGHNGCENPLPPSEPEEHPRSEPIRQRGGRSGRLESCWRRRDGLDKSARMLRRGDCSRTDV